MNEANVFEALMKGTTFEVDDRVEQAYRAGVEAGRKEYEEKHWSECRQISAYEAENKRLKELLLDSMSKIAKGCINCDCQILSAECKSRPSGKECFRWEHHEEAMKIIKGEE
jgi:hypothetical protein